MNYSSLVGFFLAISIFVTAVVVSFKDLRALLNIEALLIVIGGTFAATVICFPMSKVFKLLGVFVRRVFNLQKRDFNDAIKNIVALSQAHKQSPAAFRDALQKISDPLLRDAAEILVWVKGEINADDLKRTLMTRAGTHYNEYINDAKIFRTIAKFPPAFGLMGTTIGMIALLQSLGDLEAAKSQIGPAMGISLVATLYGLLLANFLFVPIAENLTKSTHDDARFRQMVINGVMLIQAGKPTRYIEEHLKSYQLPSERQNGSAVGAEAASGRTAA